MSTVPASEPRMTRSRARALGGSTPVRDLISDVKKAATALLRSKSKTKRDAAAPEEEKDTRSLDVATNLFDEQAAGDQEHSTQEVGGTRDQDQSCASAELELPANEAPAMTDSAEAAQSLLTIAAPPASPQPAPQPSACDMDAMAISPLPMTAAAASPAPMSPAVRPFGTPVEMDYMAASPMQITSPAVMAHMSPAVEDSCAPQQPIAEEFSFELANSAVADALQGAAPAAPAFEEPTSPAGTPVLTQGTAATATPTQAPRSAVRTPRAASVQGVAPRSAAKPPLSALKPSATKTPAGQRATPVVPSSRAPATAERTSKGTAAKSALKASEPVVPAVTPASAKAAATSVASKVAGQRTAKRVSIATPVGSGSTASRHIVRTPYPRSGSKTPVTWAGDALEAEEVPEDGNDAHIDGVQTVAAEAVAMQATSAANPVATQPEQQSAIDDPAARLVDATMQLAAALPPSYRNTCEEAPAAQQADQLAVTPTMPTAATPVPAMVHDSSMDLDMDEPAAISLAPSGAFQQAGTPDFGSLSARGAATPMAIATAPLYTPTSARMQMAAKLPGRTTPGATTPKLTIPGASAAYMASTKSFEQKARPLTMDGGSKAAAVASKPRVKSQAVGVPGDDRSLKQLKREIKAAMDTKKADVKGLESDDEMEEAPYNQADEAMLVDAMSSKVNISKPTRVILKGLPAAQGSHVRFHDDGKAVASPSNGRVYLKGLPAASGKHMRFD